MKTYWETDTRVQPLVASLDAAKSSRMGMAWIPLGMYHGKICNITVLLTELFFKN